MYKFIYLILKHRLSIAVPELKDINIYMLQDKTKGGFKALPGAYIQFKTTPVKSLGKRIQEGTVKFDVFFFTDHVSDQDKFVSDTILNHFDLSDKINNALAGFSGWLSYLPAFASLANTPADYKIFNTIDRTDIDLQPSNGVKQKTTQTFSCYAKDYSAIKAFTAATADLLILEIDLKTPL